VTDVFRITAGGRFSSEDKSGSRVAGITTGVGGPNAPAGLVDVLYLNLLGIERHSVAGDRSEDNFSPLVNLQYDFGERSMAYLSWARGYKSGGYDARSNRAPPAGTFEYEPEKATSYELGVKTSIGGVAEVNAAVFFTSGASSSRDAGSRPNGCCSPARSPISTSSGRATTGSATSAPRPRSSPG
jgi:outer membrane receptor protein involved in Fe transport